MATRLDANQVIKKVYDDDTESLRTLATVAVADITFDVNLDAEDDSVTIAQNGVDISAANSLYTQTTNGTLETTQLSVLSQLQNLDRNTGATTSNTLRVSSNIMGIDPNGAIVENKESGLVNSNSTTTPLLAGQIFTGAWVDASRYSCISWTVNADVDSAVNGLRLQFSHDGSTIIRQSATNFTGSANGVFFSFPVHAKYFRIYFENGAVNQTRFLLDTQLHEEYNGLAAVPLDTQLNDKSTATTVKSIISGKTVDGVYVNQRASGVSTLNSTSTLLGSSGAFTGTWEDVLGYSTIAISVYSDVSSAENGLILEYSSDGVNVDDIDLYTVPTSNGNQFTVGVISRYFRIRYINGTSAQSEFRLSSIYHITNIKPSSHRIEDSISGQNDAELSKAVLTGKNPNDVFINIQAQGEHDANTTNVPLDANEVYRGTWHKWADTYATLISSIKSDVAGTLYIDASVEVAPADGVDTDITYTSTNIYNPALIGVLRRNTPLQSVWVRHRYINGPAAQSEFHLNAIFTITDPGSVYIPAREMPNVEALSAIGRSILTVQNTAGDGYQDLPIDVLTGDPKVTVQTIRDDILLKPMTSVDAQQFVVGTTPVRIDPSPLSNRRKVLISNDTSSKCSIGFSSGITYSSGSFVLKENIERELEVADSVELWAVAENTGGVQTTYTRTGVTTGGTATNTGNTILSDDIYANITANSQTSTITGFTAGTANPLVSVKLGMEASKQSGQFETVTFIDVVTGIAADTGSVTSASVTSNVLYKYLVSISWKKDTASITGVSGMGATWGLVSVSPTGGDCMTAVYINTTVPLINDPITATFSITSGGAVIAVSRYSGVNLASPVQNFESFMQNPATASYSDSIIGTAKGMLVSSVGLNTRTHTVGSGATERVEIASAALAAIAVNTLSLATTANHAYSGTLSGNAKLTYVALTLNPADAIDPRVTLSYELSAVPGATSSLVTLASTSDSNSTVNITGDRAWVVADIPNVKIVAMGTLIGAAAANIDQLYLELVDSTGNTTRISVVQFGRSF